MSWKPLKNKDINVGQGPLKNKELRAHNVWRKGCVSVILLGVKQKQMLARHPFKKNLPAHDVWRTGFHLVALLNFKPSRALCSTCLSPTMLCRHSNHMGMLLQAHSCNLMAMWLQCSPSLQARGGAVAGCCAQPHVVARMKLHRHGLTFARPSE
jgi:hypothetical protein